MYMHAYTVTFTVMFFLGQPTLLEEAELLCTVISDTGTGVIILPQVPLP
jgi:hypothetical protein